VNTKIVGAGLITRIGSFLKAADIVAVQEEVQKDFDKIVKSLTAQKISIPKPASQRIKNISDSLLEVGDSTQQALATIIQLLHPSSI